MNPDMDSATVKQIAHLARIHIPDAQLPALVSELGSVLDLVRQLAVAALDNVEPLTHPLNESLRLREDIVTAVGQREAFMCLAPETQSGLYLVPKVIE